MRISDGANPGIRIDLQHDVDLVRGGAPAGRAPSSAPDVASEYSSGPELAQLIAAVRATDDVRPGRVEEVSQRLAAGFYDSHEAAERTAEAILDGS